MSEDTSAPKFDFTKVPAEYWLNVCGGYKAAAAFLQTSVSEFQATIRNFPILWLPEFPAAMEELARKIEARMEGVDDYRLVDHVKALRSEADILRKFQASARRDFVQDDAFLLEQCAVALSAASDGDRRVNLLRAFDLFHLSARVSWDRRETASLFMNLAIVQQRLAEIGINRQKNLQEALQLYERAKSNFEPESLKFAQCLVNEGNCRLILGRVGSDAHQNLERAVELFQRATKMLHEGSDIGRCLMNEGVARRNLADLDVNRQANLQAAIDLPQQARTVLPPTSEHFLSCLMNEAVARKDLAELGIAWKENLFEAIRLLKLAATMFKAGGRDFASCRMNEGIALVALANRGVTPQENYENAIAFLDQARKIFGSSDSLSFNRCLTHEAHARLGLCVRNIEPQRNLEIAFRLYQEAANRQRETSPREAIHSFANLGLVCLEKDLNDLARNAYGQAIQLLEDVRATASQIDDRRWWMENYINLFKGMIESCLRLGQYTEAVEYVERSRSRTLLELLATEEIVPRNLPQEQTAGQMKESFAASELPTTNEIDPSEEANQSSGSRILHDEVRWVSPDFLALAKPLQLVEMIELAQKLQRTLVVVWVGRQRAAIFFVSSAGELDHVSLPDVTDSLVQEWMFGSSNYPVSSRGWIGTYLGYCEGTIPEAEWMKQIEQTLSLLYNRIMKPIHQWLDAHEDVKRTVTDLPDEPPRKFVTHRIALIAGGALGLLPLHAARWQDNDQIHYLIENLDIAFAPSAWLLKRCAERDGKHWLPILTLSNPKRLDSAPLPFTVWETEQIKQMIETKYGDRSVDSLETTSATLQRVRELLPTHPIAHFACHGQWDFQHPLQSALMLAGIDCLRLGELLSKVDMKQAKLVVLSACESGAGYRPGSTAEEYLGLPAGFIIAGAETVVGSLWAVPDAATALLMKRLYYDLLEGKGASEALRQAQLWLKHLNRDDAIAMMRESVGLHTSTATRELIRNYTKGLEDLEDRPFAHPYHWAAFAAFGSPKQLFF